MPFVVMNELDEGLEVRRSDEEEPSLLLDEAVLDLLLGDEGDGERVGHALAHSDQKTSVHVDPRQHVFGLLTTPRAVKPRL